MSARKIPKVPRRVPRCQWVEGIQGKHVSGFVTCQKEGIFEVHSHGIFVARCCAKHSTNVIQQNFQIR